MNKDEFHSADRLIKKYGSDKIVHIAWPDDYIIEPKKVIDTLAALAEDREIRVLIINQAIPGTNAAIDKFKEKRRNVFTIMCGIQEPVESVIRRANLAFDVDVSVTGTAIAKQAQKQGAKVFVHYSFPRHMQSSHLASYCESIHKACLAEDIFFVNAVTPDPAGEAGIDFAQQFILDDVPRLVAQYGEDTAFFCSACLLQKSLIQAVVDSHAIYPQPCCPSPFHGFPEALGIDTSGDFFNLNYVISEACRIAAEKNMTDRLSTWPVSTSMMYTNAGAAYAIKWLNGEVSKHGIDNEVLVKCMQDYIVEEIGEESNILLTSYSEDGKTYNNFKLVLMSYLDL